VVPEDCTQATKLLLVLCILHEDYGIVKGNVSIEPMKAVNCSCGEGHRVTSAAMGKSLETQQKERQLCLSNFPRPTIARHTTLAWGSAIFALLLSIWFQSMTGFFPAVDRIQVLCVIIPAHSTRFKAADSRSSGCLKLK
jgi:hypothetical protein